MYSIKEIFYTLQGEGAMAGRASIFCRFSGCNLWTGQERHRQKAVCKFCDTDFIGTNGINGNKYSAQDLAVFINNLWQENVNMGNAYPMCGKPYVVLTGGEPLLQVDEDLLKALHNFDFEIAIETNGTLELVKGLDWICVSPKFGSTLKVFKGNELKVVYPQEFNLLDYEYFAKLDFDNFFIQAKDDKDKQLAKINIQKAIEFCQKYPKWRLSTQTHKYLGIA